jgi:hypothetical protein
VAFPLLAGCALLASQSPPVRLGAEWNEAQPHLVTWSQKQGARCYQTQDLDRTSKRSYPVFDSLMLAQIYRRVGHLPPRFQRFEPAPDEAGIVCRENYIFYLRGDQIVGVEYREVVSNGQGGYRQNDDSIGELPGAVSSSY